VNADAKDHEGVAPLSRAASHGLEGGVQLLLQTEMVEVDSKDHDSRTPLSRAAGVGTEVSSNRFFRLNW
jgi:ankyrin repeat protein